MKKIFLRVLCFMLCALTVVSFAACSSGDNDSNNDTLGDTPDPDSGNSGNLENPENPENPDDSKDPPAEVFEEVDLDTLIEKLTSSIYSDKIKATSFVGLSDASLVGIDKDKLDEILYPIPADDECAKVINVNEKGVLPNGEDCSEAFKTVIAELEGVDGVKKIVFPEGDYKFSETIKLKDLEDVYFCSESNEKRFSITMTKWRRGIQLENCKNMHFNNFDFDYENPSAVTGTIASTAKNTVVIDIDPGYDLTNNSYGDAGFIYVENGNNNRYGSYMEYRYDEATKKYVPDASGNLLYNSTGDPWNSAILKGTYDAAKNQLTLNFKDGRFKTPDVGIKVNVAYTMYEYFGFHATGGENIYVEGVTFYHTMGMAMGMSSVNNIYLNRFKLTPKEGRLMTATADGFHCGSCTGEIIVTNSVFEYSHDDCFNIKGAYGKVVANTPKAISCDLQKMIPIEVGDVLDFYSSTDFKHLGSFTVKKVEKARVEFKESLSGIDLTNAYIANDTQICSLTVKNSFFGNKRNRGMLIQCRDIVIDGCTFQNIIHTSLQIFSAADHFAEGIMPKNVVIKNNKFMHNGSGDVSVFTSGPEGAVSGTIIGVETSNNFFFESQGRPISYGSAGASKITDNFIYNFRASLDSAINVYTSENVEILKNFVKGDYSNVEFEALKIDGKSTENITNKNNILNVKKAD